MQITSRSDAQCASTCRFCRTLPSLTLARLHNDDASVHRRASVPSFLPALRRDARHVAAVECTDHGAHHFPFRHPMELIKCTLAQHFRRRTVAHSRLPLATDHGFTDFDSSLAEP